MWLLMRALLPDIPAIRKLVVNEQTTMSLFCGQYDRLIPPRLGQQFAADCGKPELLNIMETGHHLMTPEMDKAIAARLATAAQPPLSR